MDWNSRVRAAVESHSESYPRINIWPSPCGEAGTTHGDHIQCCTQNVSPNPLDMFGIFHGKFVVWYNTSKFQLCLGPTRAFFNLNGPNSNLIDKIYDINWTLVQFRFLNPNLKSIIPVPTQIALEMRKYNSNWVSLVKSDFGLELGRTPSQLGLLL